MAPRDPSDPSNLASTRFGAEPGSAASKPGLPAAFAFAGLAVFLAFVVGGAWAAATQVSSGPSLTASLPSFSLESLRDLAAEHLAPNPESDPFAASPEAAPEPVPTDPEALAGEGEPEGLNPFEGFQLLAGNQFSEADEAFTTALAAVEEAADDLRASLWLGRGDARLLLGRRDEARADYESALAACDRAIAVLKADEARDEASFLDARRKRTVVLGKLGRYEEQATETRVLVVARGDEANLGLHADLLEAQVRAGQRADTSGVEATINTEGEEDGLRLVAAAYVSAAALRLGEFTKAKLYAAIATKLASTHPTLPWDFVSLEQPLEDADAPHGACVAPLFTALGSAARAAEPNVLQPLLAYMQCVMRSEARAGE